MKYVKEVMAAIWVIQLWGRSPTAGEIQRFLANKGIQLSIPTIRKVIQSLAQYGDVTRQWMSVAGKRQAWVAYLTVTGMGTLLTDATEYSLLTNEQWVRLNEHYCNTPLHLRFEQVF